MSCPHCLSTSVSKRKHRSCQNSALGQMVMTPAGVPKTPVCGTPGAFVNRRVRVSTWDSGTTGDAHLPGPAPADQLTYPPPTIKPDAGYGSAPLRLDSRNQRVLTP